MSIQLSVIIPVYNCEEFINRCVESVIAQTIFEMEIVLVDDGSTDKSGEICNFYQEKDSRVLTIHKPNGGVSSARNRGLDIAKGKYIWFIDGDDYIEPDCVRVLLNVANKNELDLLQFGWNIFENGRKVVSRRLSETSVMSFNSYVRDNCFYGTGSQSFIRRELISSHNRFVEGLKIGEDGLFFLELFSNIKRAQKINFKVYNYCQNTNSITYNIPFLDCLEVAKKASSMNMTVEFKQYQMNFVAFYSSLSLYSLEYNKDVLYDYYSHCNSSTRSLFFSKLLQHLISYNYGVLRVKKIRSNRILSVNKIKWFFKINSMMHSGLDIQYRLLIFIFEVLPTAILDIVFQGVAMFYKLFFLSK